MPDHRPSAEVPPAGARGSARVCYVVAPDGQAGGGMGRVKDYIVQSGGDRFGRVRVEALVTRDQGGFVRSLWLTLKAILAIWAARLSGRLALVHVNFGDRGSAVRKGLVVAAARLSGAPVVLHLHAVELKQQYEKGGTLLRFLIRIPFRMASHNLVLGEIWRRWLVEDFGIAGDKVEILFNGVPVEIGPPRRVVAKAEPVEILFLGNLIERKGVSDLIEALARLPADLPAWRITLAGGGDIERYRDMAARLGLGERARFAGWVDQAGARDLLGASDLLVLPSYDEGLPLVILEALGSGTPVLCTPIGAIPEALTDGHTARFCTPGDKGDISAKLAELIGTPELRQRLSDNGRADFVARFSLGAFLQALFGIYRRRFGVEIVPAAVELSGERP